MWESLKSELADSSESSESHHIHLLHSKQSLKGSVHAQLYSIHTDPGAGEKRDKHHEWSDDTTDDEEYGVNYDQIGYQDWGRCHKCEHE